MGISIDYAASSTDNLQACEILPNINHLFILYSWTWPFPAIISAVVYILWLWRFHMICCRNIKCVPGISLAFCQGLAFDFCVSALPQKRWMHGFASQNLAPPAKDSLRSSFASGGLAPSALGLAPSALDTRASRSYSRSALVLALRARGLFLTDHSKPSLWQRLVSPMRCADFQ